MQRIMYFCSNVIWYFSAFSLLGHFMGIVNEPKYPDKKFWYCGKFYLLIGVIDGLLGITYQIQYVLSILLMLLYVWVFFLNRKKRNMLSACMFATNALIVHYFFERIGNNWVEELHIMKVGTGTLIYPVVSTCAVVSLFVVYRFIMLYQFKIRGVQINLVGWLFFLGTTIYSIMFVYLILLIRNYPLLYTQNRILILGLLLGIVFFNAFSLAYGNDIEMANQLKGKLKGAEERNQRTYEYYRNMELRNAESKKLLHDVKNHMQVLEALYKSGEKGEAEEYAASLMQQIENSYQKCYSSHKLIDIILLDKEKKAEKSQIRMHYEVDEIDWSFISDYDLSTILCNLLDNAITCCEKIALEKRDIRVKLRKVNGFVVLCFENLIEPEHVKEMEEKVLLGRIKVGTGLQNVRRVVKDNNGDFTIDVNGKQFKVTITFSI